MNIHTSVLDKQVSYYPNTKATNQGITQNLLRLLLSDKHKEKITALRNAPAEQQSKLKNDLPCFTATGIFEGGRNEECLIHPSGLACVDLDSAEDYDVLHLLNELKKIPYIAYAGLSCRGKRLFCIVPFKYPEQYKQQYQRLVRSFEDIGTPMGDDCHKTLSQPRFVSWNSDDTRFFNHNASLYDLIQPEKRYYPSVVQIIAASSARNKNETRTQVEKLIAEIQSKRIDIAPDYQTYLSVGFSFASEFSEEGRSLFHAVCSVSQKYNEPDAERKYTDCINSKTDGRHITIATFFFLCREAGIEIPRSLRH